VVLLGFIVDFFCPKARLVVEVDGGYHEQRVAADAKRDRKLNCAGYRVVRVDAQLVHRDLACVLRVIAHHLR
jgi:very-short-patch-repair endonuclease